jgi:hypothetical protein
MVNNIQLAAGGGLIKKPIKAYQGGGMVGGSGSLLKGIYPGYSRSVGGTMASSGGMGGSSNSASMSPMKISSLGGMSGSSGGMSGSSGGMMRGGGGMSGSSARAMSKGKAMSGAGASSGGGMSISNYKSTSNNFFMGSSGAGNSGSLTNIMNTIKNTSNYKLSSIPSNTQEFGSDRNTLYSPPTLSSKNVLNQSAVGSKTLPNTKPINISPPPTRTVAPGPPVIYTKTTYTVLPPIKAPSKAPPSVPRGAKLPEFSASGISDPRSKIATALGIADLVGVV